MKSLAVWWNMCDRRLKAYVGCLSHEEDPWLDSPAINICSTSKTLGRFTLMCAFGKLGPTFIFIFWRGTQKAIYSMGSVYAEEKYSDGKYRRNSSLFAVSSDKYRIRFLIKLSDYFH